MSTNPNVTIDQMVFRKTHAHMGRRISVTPSNSTMQHLAYGRIILDSRKSTEEFSTVERETGLIILSGQAIVTVDDKEHLLGRYDAIYIPRDSSVKITSRSTADIAEFSADVATRYPLQVVHVSQVSTDPGLKFSTGGAGSSRQLPMLLAKNVEAGRLVAGFTVSEPGNWTSWPPHEHAKMLEEMYVYFNMPDPAFGIQLYVTDHATFFSSIGFCGLAVRAQAIRKSPLPLLSRIKTLPVQSGDLYTPCAHY